MDRMWRNAVELGFWSLHDCASRDIGSKFLGCLQRHGFHTKKFGDEDPPQHKFDPSSPNALLEIWAQHPSQLVIENLAGNPGFQALAHLDTRTGVIPTYFVFAVDERSLESKEGLRNFLSFAEECYNIFKPVYGHLTHSKDLYDKTVVISPILIGGRTSYEEAHLPVNPLQGLPGVYWANFLGPVYVNFFTRKIVESAPCHSSRQLADGGFLILTSESPLHYSKPETKKLEQAFIRHMGEDAIFDKANPRRVLRSPFPTADQKPPVPSSPRRELSGNLRTCPDCGETVRIAEMPKDHVNRMHGFRCLNCNALWTVHASLLK